MIELCCLSLGFFFFKRQTANELRIRDWSSDVCSSDLLRYRLLRHPIMLFGIGPAIQFIVLHRLPWGLMRGGWKPWISAMATNVAIALIVSTLIWQIGRAPCREQVCQYG